MSKQSEMNENDKIIQMGAPTVSEQLEVLQKVKDIAERAQGLYNYLRIADTNKSSTDAENSFRMTPEAESESPPAKKSKNETTNGEIIEIGKGRNSSENVTENMDCRNIEIKQEFDEYNYK